MFKILSAFFLLFLVPLHAAAQVTPTEGREVNYRIIGFSFPSYPGAVSYSIEIATGKYSNDDDFQKNMSQTLTTKKNKLLVEVPSFGTQYTWRIICKNNNGSTTKSEFYHFATLTCPQVDTDTTRLRILVPPEKYTDMYVFVDATKTLYDLNGHAVWFIPDIEGIPTRYILPRDLKRSSFNTITFMTNEQAYEINYNGDILWKEPETAIDSKQQLSQKIKSLHHHEFTRLSNGHYMTLGMEQVSWQVQGTIDTSRIRYKTQIKLDSNGKMQQSAFTGRITELDQKHNIVWSWGAADYFKNSDLYYRRRPNGLFQIGNTHENAFYFDEKAKLIYVSFRNISRVVKLQYPNGRILNTYGQLYVPGNFEMINDLFCGQHCCRRSQDGYLYLYNNNTCNRLCGRLPTIIMMQEPATSKGQLKKVWEYECTLDSNMSAEEQAKIKFETGGSVFELPDRSILCCMAGNYDKVFIVNRDKKILWSALPEQWDINEKKWKVVSGYRASIISRAELESLVWGEPLKK